MAVITDNRPYFELMVSLQACRNKFQFLIAVGDDLQTLISVINQCDRQVNSKLRADAHATASKIKNSGIGEMAFKAPDIWSYRSGVFYFD